MEAMKTLLLSLTALVAVSLAPTPTATAADRPDRSPRATSRAAAPIVIAHRGASGYRPEHTLEAYRLAIRMGADYVEPDLVSTKDGVLVARHENEISTTTDVADHPEFAARRTTKVVDGATLTGWFTEDFTLAELKTLHAKERLPAVRQENTSYDGRYQVPTFQEVIDLVRQESRRAGRRIGIYPETKHPTYFDRLGLSLEKPLARALRRNGLAGRNDKVYVQSFETGNLRELNRLVDVPLVQLTGASGAPYDLVAAGDPRSYADLTTPAGLAEVATYADAIGPDKTQVIPRNPDGTLGNPTSLVADAHRAGLLVHAYTFRAENVFLPTDYQRGADPTDFGDLVGEVQAYLATGLDGFFTDQPDLGVLARDDFVAARLSSAA